MMTSTQVERDFRKWIAYNPELQKPQSLYDLYQALSTSQSHGQVQWKEEAGVVTISMTGTETALELVGLAAPEQMLQYLKSHFLPDGNPDIWLQTQPKAEPPRRVVGQHYVGFRLLFLIPGLVFGGKPA